VGWSTAPRGQVIDESLGQVPKKLVSSPPRAGKDRIITDPADPGRSGNFVVPSLNWDRASSLQLDGNFHARVSGHVYAQPLYWRGSASSSGVLLVATEGNVVHAIDAVSGHTTL
jgi:hypothetical protein